MEFLSQYGLFLLKALTIVGAIVMTVAGILMLAVKEKGLEQIQLKKLNKKFEGLQNSLKHTALSKKELKQQQKEQKKRNKEEANIEKQHQPRTYVIDFEGDIKASEVGALREEISAAIALARPEIDEVVVLVDSGGGMVHTYGLAAAQLDRLRRKNINLTVCVDKIAASGGYMMACVANKILAAPFSIVGSIGVVAQIPNLHRLLKKHQVDIEMHTAGQFKRTLTLLGENTEEGRKKFIAELEETHALFKNFIHQYRPQVDLSSVATGEHWYGVQGLNLKLVDEIKTSDEYIQQMCETHDVYQITYKAKKKLSEKIAASFAVMFTTLANKVWTESQRSEYL